MEPTIEQLQNTLNSLNAALGDTPVKYSATEIGKVANDGFAEPWVQVHVETPGKDTVGEFWSGGISAALNTFTTMYYSYMLTESWRKNR